MVSCLAYPRSFKEGRSFERHLIATSSGSTFLDDFGEEQFTHPNAIRSAGLFGFRNAFQLEGADRLREPFQILAMNGYYAAGKVKLHRVVAAKFHGAE